MLPTVYTVDLVSAATSTSMVTLNETYDSIWMTRGAMASMATIYVQASHDGTTFKRVLFSEPGLHPIASAVTSVFHYATSVSGYFAPVPTGFQYIKFETASAPATTISFNVIASKFGR